MSALVIYHAECYDGFTAAWVARRRMPGCELFEGRYGEEPPYLEAVGRDVYVLDFSYPREQMLKLEQIANSLFVLDHHKTAEANCQGLGFCQFDMERSGCRMAWDYFFPHSSAPDWLLRIEDRDLWRFAYPETKDVHAYVASLPMVMEDWDEINETAIEDLEIWGSSIRRYIETCIDKMLPQSRLITDTNNEQVVVLNMPYLNASDAADAMLKKYPEATYSLTYFQRSDSTWQYSLRSRSDFDVSEIAECFGGGGHAQAAGFETDELLTELA